MKKEVSVPGIRYVLKRYHDIMLMVLEEYQQTQKDAAKQLGISVGTFQRILRLEYLPDFRSDWGKALKSRFEEWSTLPIDLLFPEAFLTKEFFQTPKTISKTVPMRLLMNKSRHGEKVVLALPAPPKPTPRPARRKKPAKKSRRSARA